MNDKVLSEHRNWPSIIMLFLVMMLSGGNHLFIRNPICLFVIVVYGVRICRLLGGLTLQCIPRRIWYFFTAFLCVIALQAIILNIFDSAAIAALSNIIAGMIVYAYYKLADTDALISEFVTVMKIMIVMGLISAILYTFFPDSFSTYKFTDSYGDERTVSHVAFLFYRGVIGAKERLYGFFWEPGIYQIYLNIFLIFQLNRYYSKTWIFTTILSIILTASTTGYIILSIILLHELFKKVCMIKNRYTVVAVLVVAVVAFGYGYKIVTDNISDKVSGENQGSFLARQADVIAGLTIAYENPLIGIGANTDRFKQMRSRIAWQGELTGSQTKDTGNTNGLISLMYIWGIPLAIWYLWGLCRQKLISSSKWVMAVLLLLSLNSEPLAMTPFFLLFTYSGLDNTFEPNS